jgi:hypothetical protein
MEQEEKLSGFPVHPTRTPNSDIKAWEGSKCWNFDFYVEEATEGEILIAYYYWVGCMRGMQCNVGFGYQLSCSKDREKPRKTLNELAGRRTFRIKSVPQTEHRTSPLQNQLANAVYTDNHTESINIKCSYWLLNQVVFYINLPLGFKELKSKGRHDRPQWILAIKVFL